MYTNQDISNTLFKSRRNLFLVKGPRPLGGGGAPGAPPLPGSASVSCISLIFNVYVVIIFSRVRDSKIQHDIS